MTMVNSGLQGLKTVGLMADVLIKQLLHFIVTLSYSLSLKSFHTFLN